MTVIWDPGMISFGPGGAGERDLSLRRVERDAAIACVAMAAIALALQRGGTSGALGVIGGGALMAFSFRTIRRGVDAMVQRVAPRPDQEAGAPVPGRGRVGLIVLTFALRYVVIGVLAWALLVPLHAHPVGLIAGVTAPVVALTFEAVRLQRR
jgi:hypothetical protein